MDSKVKLIKIQFLSLGSLQVKKILALQVTIIRQMLGVSFRFEDLP